MHEQSRSCGDFGACFSHSFWWSIFMAAQQLRFSTVGPTRAGNIAVVIERVITVKMIA